MSDADAVAALRKRHIDAFNRADVEGMLETVTDDMVSMAPNLPAYVGKEALRPWWQGGFDSARSQLGCTSTELVVAGEWAFDRFAWTMETTPSAGGETTRDNGDGIWISKKGPDGSWRLARAIWNSDNPAGGIWAGASRS